MATLSQVVCYTAVFSVVTQSSLHDDTKNGCVADYISGYTRLISLTPEQSIGLVMFRLFLHTLLPP